jgi:hypothetical protein
MSLAKSRSRIFVRGLGTMRVRLTEPTVDTDFSDVGYLQEVQIADEAEMEDIVADTGDLINYLEKTRKAAFTAQLMQTGKDEADLSRLAASRVYSVQYFGNANKGGTVFQYFCIPSGKIQPGLSMKMATGARMVPLAIRALKDYSQAYDPWDYVMFQGNGAMDFTAMRFFSNPLSQLNAESQYILDISGFQRNGTHYAARGSTIWYANATPPEYWLRYSGANNDSTDFGNVDDLNDGGSAGPDWAVECWLKFPAVGALEEIWTKKALITGNTAGWALYKNIANTVAFTIGTGAAAVTATSTGTLGVSWGHIAVALDRNGNMQIYINGVADGAPASVSGTATCTTTTNMFFGKDGSNFGQFDMGAARFHKWAAGAMPTDMAAFFLAHYNAEKALYGY